MISNQYIMIMCYTTRVYGDGQLLGQTYPVSGHRQWRNGKQTLVQIATTLN